MQDREDSIFIRRHIVYGVRAPPAMGENEHPANTELARLEFERTYLPLHCHCQPHRAHCTMYRLGDCTCPAKTRWIVADVESRAIVDTVIRHSSWQALHLPVGVDVRVVLFRRGRGPRLVRTRLVGEPGTC